MNYKDITNGIAKECWLKNAYDIEVDAKTEGALLVKSIAVSGVGEGVPDSENIKNGKEDYIVPGSSFRGAVRART